MWQLKFKQLLNSNTMKQLIFRKNLGFLVLLLGISILSNSQDLIEPTCPNPNGGQRAYNRVMYFLTLSEDEERRTETGANIETVAQIRPVSDEAICEKLNEIVNGNPLYKKVDDNLDSKRTKYYYRTENLYYIFWAKKPEYDGIPSTGPKTLFIVISSDYKQIWQYYL
jgi:hypothetical protein